MLGRKADKRNEDTELGSGDGDCNFKLSNQKTFTEDGSGQRYFSPRRSAGNEFCGFLYVRERLHTAFGGGKW